MTKIIQLLAEQGDFRCRKKNDVWKLVPMTR